MTRTRSWPAILLLALGLLVPAGVFSQESETAPPTAAPAVEIFSGTVTRLTDQSLTVVRRIAGKAPVSRDFIRNAATTVEGKLRTRARVTVRYRAGESGEFIAIHIIVR